MCGFSLVAVRGLLIAVASLVAENGALGCMGFSSLVHRLGSWGSQALDHGLSSCGTWA